VSLPARFGLFELKMGFTMTFKRMALSKKLTFTSILLVIVPVLAIGIHSTWFLIDFSKKTLEKNSQVIEGQAFELLSVNAGNQRSFIEKTLNQAKTDALSISKSVSDIQLDSNSPELKAQFASKLADSCIPEANSTPLYNHLALYSTAGKLVYSAGTQADANAWFTTNQQFIPGRLIPGDLRMDSNSPVLVLAAPVFSNKQLKGFVELSLSWDVINKAIASRNTSKTAFYYVVTSTGRLVMHPRYTYKDNVNICLGKHGDIAKLACTTMIKGKSGSGRFKFDGQDLVTAFVPVKVGSQLFTVGVVTGAKQFYSGVGDFKAQAHSKMIYIISAMVPLIVILALAGTVIGIKLSKAISDPLRNIINKLSTGAEQVTSASGQLAQSSQEIAEGSAHQAANLEETSSSLEEIASLSKTSAANAQDAQHLADKSLAIADSGSESMKSMRDAMTKIQDSSSQTAKIVKLIDEIAFQTKLLALNAAIEAARAGEAGKSFAVVAAEVKILADRCSAASKQITEMIQAAVHNTTNGVTLAGKVDKVLEDIITSTTSSAKLVKDIAEATKQQVNGIDQINSAVTEMNNVTQQNAASAEESASLGQELSIQASSMNNVVQELIILIEGVDKNNQGQYSNAASDWFHRIAEGKSAHSKAAADSDLPSSEQSKSE
jgi:hypothetical protein